ncbi:MAG: hypothetical protein ACRD0A_09240 [Acidimicrobiales bacterium]
MFTEVRVLLPLMQALWGRLKDLRADDRGMTTEAVIVTAFLAALAIGATAIITIKVTQAANDIDVQTP